MFKKFFNWVFDRPAAKELVLCKGCGLVKCACVQIQPTAEVIKPEIQPDVVALIITEVVPVPEVVAVEVVAVPEVVPVPEVVAVEAKAAPVKAAPAKTKVAPAKTKAKAAPVIKAVQKKTTKKSSKKK